MQVVPHDNVEQVVGSQSAIACRFDVIAGHKEFLLAIRSRKDSRFGIIGAVSEKLQSQKRMRSAAFSQINFDRVWLPFSIFRPHNDEIQSEATNNPLFGQTFAYLCSFLSNNAGVSRVGRENAAEIALPSRPAQELVMRR